MQIYLLILLSSINFELINNYYDKEKNTYVLVYTIKLKPLIKNNDKEKDVK